jgi:hypothetical protein
VTAATQDATSSTRRRKRCTSDGLIREIVSIASRTTVRASARVRRFEARQFIHREITLERERDDGRRRCGSLPSSTACAAAVICSITPSGSDSSSTMTSCAGHGCQANGFPLFGRVARFHERRVPTGVERVANEADLRAVCLSKLHRFRRQQLRDAGFVEVLFFRDPRGKTEDDGNGNREQRARLEAKCAIERVSDGAYSGSKHRDEHRTWNAGARNEGELAEQG